jgi:uncharacterized protein YjbI with pentapeptide repeats
MSNQTSPREDSPVLPAPPRNPPSTSWLPAMIVVLALTLVALTANVFLLSRSLEHQRQASREHNFWVLCQPGHSLAERTAAFHHLAAQGNKEWRSAQLSEMNLHGISLPGADLASCAFLRANLANANLPGARLAKASLEMADLTGADLSEADLSEAHLYRAILNTANLRRAKLRTAILQEVKGQSLDLMAADLSDADCLMANFTDSNLAAANFSGARLEAAVLKGTTLTLARFNDANLKETDFTDSNWWRARGLSSEQVEALKKKFPPSDKATASLKEDFEKWKSRPAD